jgi:hypothetical protein
MNQYKLYDLTGCIVLWLELTSGGGVMVSVDKL